MPLLATPFLPSTSRILGAASRSEASPRREGLLPRPLLTSRGTLTGMTLTVVLLLCTPLCSRRRHDFVFICLCVWLLLLLLVCDPVNIGSAMFLPVPYKGARRKFR